MRTLAQRHLLARSVLLALKDFDEAQHPRDEHGRFSAGGGSDLQTGKIGDIVNIGGGINMIYKGKIGDQQVIIKPESGLAPGALRYGINPGHDLERERAAYLVATHLNGLVSTPETVIRAGPGAGDTRILAPQAGDRLGVHTYVDDVSGYATQGGAMFRDIDNDTNREFAPNPSNVAMYDYLIGNTDRHDGNLLYENAPNDEVRPVAIDHGLAFPSADENNGHNWIGDVGATNAMDRWGGDDLTDEQSKALGSFVNNEPAIRDELSPLLGKGSIDGMFDRARWMQQQGYIPTDFKDGPHRLTSAGRLSGGLRVGDLLR